MNFPSLDNSIHYTYSLRNPRCLPAEPYREVRFIDHIPQTIFRLPKRTHIHNIIIIIVQLKSLQPFTLHFTRYYQTYVNLIVHDKMTQSQERSVSDRQLYQFVFLCYKRHT